MVRLDDTSGSDPAQETLSGGSFDWKPDAIDGMWNGDMHVPVDGLKVVVSVDTSLKGGVGSDQVVEDSLNVGEEVEPFNHRFLVGDFVWGKFKNHPWWPGQVFDHRDATKYALKYFQDGRSLVAFFGDGSCGWCLPSQLVPFATNFKENNPMNPKDVISRCLFKAVQAAVDEVGRVVESTMTCNCMLPLEKRDDLARRTVSNCGVKAGATVPKVDVHRLSVPEYGPAEVLAEVIHYAKSVSVDSTLELAVLRSWLSAFYYAKDGRRLPEYHEYNVEGLEDKDQTAAAAADDQREGKGSRKSAFSLKRKMKSTDGDVAEGGSHVVSSRNNGKKIKFVASETPIVFGEDSSNAGHGAKTAEDNAKEDNSVGTPTAIVIASTENVSNKAMEESNNASTPRERKKSKYLSPPYVDTSKNKDANRVIVYSRKGAKKKPACNSAT